MLCFKGLCRQLFQSIMGATLKRRESGEGVALDTDIRDLDR